ncbi:hypothetical protein AMAG_12378 [Allomyces macrogynus ATCC 38327]|uniref:G-protein coupled receptors family 3 profile domain-containing protein n=1 Tax=Allomyces macrogynus (strain ATCC 38327) TaxID=578462 RepID=A0A0L0SXM3_ALLM3|nr:hypothetical protein AMAG_12378 [Allomyces macrogynus ATCC 38327]|eukprot:KNE67313.1 hypothetical protein AMAG_12378 [Allomyces macrogynus ATCC 38327]
MLLARGGRSWLVPILLVVAALACVVHSAEYKIAVTLPYSSEGDGLSARGIKEVLDMGIEEVNQWASTSFAGNSFSLINYDSGKGVASAVESVFDAASKGAVAVIGEYSSSATIPLALSTANFGIFTCSAAASAPINRADFPLLVRTIPPDKVQGVALAIFVKKMGWNNVAVIAASDDYGEGIKQTFTRTASDLGVSLESVQSFSPSDPTGRSYRIAIDSVRLAGVRIVMFFGTHEDLVPILRIARQAGLIGRDWVWIASEGVATLDEDMAAADTKQSGTYTAEDKDNINGLFYAFPAEVGSGFADFLKRYQERFKRTDTMWYATLFKDCLTTMARGIAKLVKRNSEKDVRARNLRGATLADFLEPYESTTSGLVQWDSSFERVMDYHLINMYGLKRRVTYTVKLDKKDLVAHDAPLYYSGTSDKPADRPEHLRGYLVYGNVGAIVIMGLVAIVAAVIVGTLVYLAMNRMHSSVKQMSLPFLGMICAGLLLILATIFLWIDVPTALICNMERWALLVGLQVTLSAVAAKAYRIYKVFDNKKLNQLHMLNDVNLFLGCLAIMLVQIVLLVVFTLVAPLAPKRVNSYNSYTYVCESTKPTLDRLFDVLSIVYNGFLVLVVSVLAWKTRKAYSAYREASFIMYSVQNVFLSAVVATPFLFISGGGGDFSLGAFWIRALVVVYAVMFTYACLVGRIALTLYLAKTKSANQGVKMNLSNEPSSSGNNGISSAEQMAGKPTTMHGKYPIKITNKLFSTWHTHRVMLLALEGYLALTRMTGDAEQGRLFRLRSVQFDPNPAEYPLCIEIRVEESYVIQFNTEEDKAQWVRALSIHCLVMSKSSANKSAVGVGDNAGSLAATRGLGPALTVGARAGHSNGGALGGSRMNPAASQLQSHIGANGKK